MMTMVYTNATRPMKWIKTGRMVCKSIHSYVTTTSGTGDGDLEGVEPWRGVRFLYDEVRVYLLLVSGNTSSLGLDFERLKF